MSKVRLRATELDVLVDDVRVGRLFNNGDCWRAFLYPPRRRKSLPDYDSRSEAVRGIVAAATGRAK